MNRMQVNGQKAQLLEPFGKVADNALASAGACLGEAAADRLRQVIARHPDIRCLGTRMGGDNNLNVSMQLLRAVEGQAVFLLTIQHEQAAELRNNDHGLAQTRTLAERENQQTTGDVAGTFSEPSQTAARAAGKPASAGHAQRTQALSAREWEVLGRLADGGSNGDISARLGMAVGTVRTHLIRIYKKLQVHSRTQAAAIYLAAQATVEQRAAVRRKPKFFHKLASLGLIISALAMGQLAGRAQNSPPAAAESLGSEARPATSNAAGQPYPKVDAQQRVEFRLQAPSAQRVQVDIGGHKYDLSKDDQGWWRGVTPPLVVGFHYYALVVDGVAMADPASESFFGVSKMMSGIDIPSTGEDFYDLKNVPHGEVREHWYFSNTNRAWRRCFVYTPPDYDSNPTARYPVVYLQHGAGEDERGWSTQGRVNFILDNLIAEGKARAMIVVMDNGGGSALFAGNRSVAGLMGGAMGTNRPVPAPNASTSPSRGGFGRGGPGLFGGAAGLFADTLLHEIIPMIDGKYRTLADREHRALAGLSMGGMQTRVIGLAHLETFANVGIFSGGTLGDLKATNSPLAKPAEFNQLVKVAFVSYGSMEGGSKSLASYHDSLVAAGITNMSYYISPGTAHEWQSWRRSFYQFAPMLFQNP